MKTNTLDLSRNLPRQTLPVVSPASSADFQPAVSPASNRLASGLTLLAFGLACGLAQAAEHPVMVFTPEEMAAFEASHHAAPALLAPLRAAEAPHVVNLLAHLPYIPQERNQGSCGNCWAWAGTGVMEIANSVQNGTRDRLSVQVINSCQTRRACCQGGWLEDVAAFYQERRSAVPWSNVGAAWRSGNGSCASASCDSISTSPRYNITAVALQRIETHGLSQALARENIKSALTQNKAVWFGFFLPSFSPFFDFWDDQPESAVWDSFPSGSSAGHAVLCVGYDESDANNPYWIMVNSWGTTAQRPNGLFRVAMNISYDNANLYWQTLNVQFAAPPANSPEIAVFAGETELIDGQAAPVDFGAAAMEDVGFARTFTVRNTGSATLNLGAVSVPTGYRVTEGLPASLAAGQQNTFTVCLEATTVGTKSGQISIVNDDRNENPFNFPVTGRVYQPPTLVWVNALSSCPNPDGSQGCPYPSVSSGYNAVARCGTLRICSGIYSFRAANPGKCALFEASGGTVMLTSGVSLPGETGDAPVTFGAPARQPDGTFSMHLTGAMGHRYQVLSSTDLVNWSLWKEFTAETDEFEIVDDDAVATPHRFFKVIMP